jgi:hypothetical protein
VPAAPSGALSAEPAAGLATVAVRVTELVVALAETGTSASMFVGAAEEPMATIEQADVP